MQRLFTFGNIAATALRGCRTSISASFCLRSLRMLLLCAAVSGAVGTSGLAADRVERLIKVSDTQRDYVGKIVALSKSTCSLMDRQGKLVNLNVSELTGFERVAERFRPHSTHVFRDELQREFGGAYEVSGTTHYLVAAPRGSSGTYAELFESIYREVEQFYRVRGFEIQTPDVPLVAIVFGSQQEFVRYCLRDGVPPGPGLLGYYSLLTNRVALFDDSSLLNGVQNGAGAAAGRLRPGIAARPAVAGDTADTIVHETIHQVGYNIGIHSRIGTTPVWMIEGLATALEPQAMRHKAGRDLQTERVNPERLQWFRSERLSRRSMGDLARLIADDGYFHSTTLDSYSESWALTFFLLENPSRRRNLAAYLHRLRQRDPSQPYSAKQRLDDFQAEFGDISRLEVEFMRYMERL